MEENTYAGAIAAPLLCLTSLLPCGFVGVMMIFYLIMFLFLAIGLVLWIIMLIDVIQRTDAEFPNPSKDQKLLWLLIVILGSWIGALVYYLIVYKQIGKAGGRKG